MDAELLKKRTKAYAVRVVRFICTLPRREPELTLGRQLLRAGTSVGANYRSACRSRSRADFISRMGIVEEECDESIYWMEMLIETSLVKEASLVDLMKEGEEILAIVVASIKTARSRKGF